MYFITSVFVVLILLISSEHAKGQMDNIYGEMRTALLGSEILAVVVLPQSRTEAAVDAIVKDGTVIQVRQHVDVKTWNRYLYVEQILTTAITLAIMRTFGEPYAPVEEALAVLCQCNVNRHSARAMVLV